jgi:hypothetical protein
MVHRDVKPENILVSMTRTSHHGNTIHRGSLDRRLRWDVRNPSREGGTVNRFAVAALLACCVIGLSGCGNRSPIAGEWSTKGEFGDSSGMATAKIALVHEGNVVSGTFTFTSLPNKALQKLTATVFSLEQARFSDNHLSFIIPIFPDNPRECLLFNLRLEGATLKGTIKENDTKVERSIAVEFQKH